MNPRIIRMLSLIVLGLGLFATLGIQVAASQLAHVGPDGNPLISGSKLAVFMFWGALPYVSLMVPLLALHFPRSAYSTYLLSVLLIVGIGLYGYMKSVYLQPHSQNEIIFFTMPVCQLFGTSVAFGCVWFFHKSRRWREKTSPSTSFSEDS